MRWELHERPYARARDLPRRPSDTYRRSMSSRQRGSAPGSVPGLHIATIAHRGRIWDTYLEFDDDPHRPDVYRARLRFDAANATDFEEAPPRTTVIIIEESYEEAVTKARSFDERQLEGLLRSALPEDEE